MAPPKKNTTKPVKRKAPVSKKAEKKQKLNDVEEDDHDSDDDNDNSTKIPTYRSTIRRMSYRTGVERLSGEVIGQVSSGMHRHMKKIIFQAYSALLRSKRKTITASDIGVALQINGITMVGHCVDPISFKHKNSRMRSLN